MDKNLYGLSQAQMMLELQAMEYFNCFDYNELKDEYGWIDMMLATDDWLGGLVSHNINFLTSILEFYLNSSNPINIEEEVNKLELYLTDYFPDFLNKLLSEDISGWEQEFHGPVHWEIENCCELTDRSYFALSYVLTAALIRNKKESLFKFLDFQNFNSSLLRLLTDSIEARSWYYHQMLHGASLSNFPSILKQQYKKNLASENANKRNKPLANIKTDLNNHLRSLNTVESKSARSLAKDLLPLIRGFDKRHRYGLSADDIQARETIAKWVVKFKKTGSVL